MSQFEANLHGKYAIVPQQLIHEYESSGNFNSILYVLEEGHTAE